MLCMYFLKLFFFFVLEICCVWVLTTTKSCSRTLCARYAKVKMRSMQAGWVDKPCIDPARLPNCQSGSGALPVARHALTRNWWWAFTIKIESCPQINTFRTWINSLSVGFSLQTVLIEAFIEAFNTAVDQQELWNKIKTGWIHRFFS